MAGEKYEGRENVKNQSLSTIKHTDVYNGDEVLKLKRKNYDEERIDTQKEKTILASFEDFFASKIIDSTNLFLSSNIQENIPTLRNEKLESINRLIEECDGIDSSYNIFKGLFKEDFSILSNLAILKQKRVLLYKKLLLPQNIYLFNEYPGLKRNIQGYLQISSHSGNKNDVFQIDYDEEIVSLLSLKKRELIEHTGLKEAPFEHEEYVQINQEIGILKMKAGKLMAQLKSNNTQNVNIEKESLEIKIRYLEKLRDDYIKDVYVSGLGVKRSPLKSYINLVHSSSQDMESMLLSVWDGVNAVRGYGANKTQLFGDMAKLEFKRLFYHPNTDIKGYVEKGITELGSDVNIAHAYQIVNASMTAFMDLVVDIGVSGVTLFLMPDEFIESMKKIPSLMKDIHHNTEKYVSAGGTLWGNDKQEFFALVAYWTVYLGCAIPLANRIPTLPNVLDFGIAKGMKGTLYMTTLQKSTNLNKQKKSIIKESINLGEREHRLKMKEIVLSQDKKDIEGAKKAFEKLNKDYETLQENLNVSLRAIELLNANKLLLKAEKSLLARDLQGFNQDKRTLQSFKNTLDSLYDENKNILDTNMKNIALDELEHKSLLTEKVVSLDTYRSFKNKDKLGSETENKVAEALLLQQKKVSKMEKSFKSNKKKLGEKRDTFIEKKRRLNDMFVYTQQQYEKIKINFDAKKSERDILSKNIEDMDNKYLLSYNTYFNEKQAFENDALTIKNNSIQLSHAEDKLYADIQHFSAGNEKGTSIFINLIENTMSKMYVNHNIQEKNNFMHK